MKMARGALPFSALLLAAGGAFATACAGEPSPAGESSAATAAVAEARSDPCAGSETEAALLGCRKQAFNRAEAAVNGVAEALLANYRRDDPAKAVALTRAQAAWTAFRAADCELTTWDSRDGSGFETYRLDCLTEAANERAAELEALREAP